MQRASRGNQSRNYKHNRRHDVRATPVRASLHQQLHEAVQHLTAGATAVAAEPFQSVRACAHLVVEWIEGDKSTSRESIVALNSYVVVVK